MKVVWADKAFAAGRRGKHAAEIREYVDGSSLDIVKVQSTAEAVAAVGSHPATPLCVVSNMRRDESQTAGIDLFEAVKDKVQTYVLFTTTEGPPDIPREIIVARSIPEVDGILHDFLRGS